MNFLRYVLPVGALVTVALHGYETAGSLPGVNNPDLFSEYGVNSDRVVFTVTDTDLSIEERVQKVKECVTLPPMSTPQKIFGAVQSAVYGMQLALANSDVHLEDKVTRKSFRTLKDLREGDDVYILATGLGLGKATVYDLYEALGDYGEVVVINFDYDNESPEQISDRLADVVRRVDISGAKIAGVGGQSSGGDAWNLAFTYNEDLVTTLDEHGTNIVVISTGAGGVTPVTNAQVFFGNHFLGERGWRDFDDVQTEEGRERFLRVNGNFPEALVDQTTAVSYQDDWLLPEGQSFLTVPKVRNVVFLRGGHFDGAGVSKGRNGQIIDLLVR